MTEAELLASSRTATKIGRTKRELVAYLKDRYANPDYGQYASELLAPWGIALTEAYTIAKTGRLWGVYSTYKHHVAYRLSQGTPVPIDVATRLGLKIPPGYFVRDGHWRKVGFAAPATTERCPDWACNEH